MITIATLLPSEAAQFLAFLQQLDTETDKMLLEPGERDRHIETSV
ncbi:hypothetical protein ACNAN0_05185 [Agrilactobacillus fermenti]|nr:hypothetical protein [Agrilactobacillus fermenti]